MVTITKQCPIFLTLGLSCSGELSLINTVHLPDTCSILAQFLKPFQNTFIIKTKKSRVLQSLQCFHHFPQLLSPSLNFTLKIGLVVIWAL